MSINPEVMLPPKNGKLDVGGALGAGFLNVIKDMGLKEPYSGQTILQTGEIAEDLTYYFATSEQVPSSVGLGVLMNKDNTVRCAGGFIVQVMPFVEEAVLAEAGSRISERSVRDTDAGQRTYTGRDVGSGSGGTGSGECTDTLPTQILPAIVQRNGSRKQSSVSERRISRK